MSGDEEYVGVTWEQDQLAWRAFVVVDGRLVYEDHFADSASAALVRELAILVKSLSAVRNFQDLSREDVCQRLLALLRERSLVDLPGSFDWLERLGIDRATFFAAAGTAPA